MRDDPRAEGRDLLVPDREEQIRLGAVRDHPALQRLDGDRRAERSPVSDASQQRQLILFELLSRAAAVAEPTTGHLGLDLFHGDLQPGGQSFDDHNQRLAMRFAGGEVTKHQVKATCRFQPTAAPLRPTSPPHRA